MSKNLPRTSVQRNTGDYKQDSFGINKGTAFKEAYLGWQSRNTRRTWASFTAKLQIKPTASNYENRINVGAPIYVKKDRVSLFQTIYDVGTLREYFYQNAVLQSIQRKKWSSQGLNNDEIADQFAYNEKVTKETNIDFLGSVENFASNCAFYGVAVGPADPSSSDNNIDDSLSMNFKTIPVYVQGMCFFPQLVNEINQNEKIYVIHKKVMGSLIKAPTSRVSFSDVKLGNDDLCMETVFWRSKDGKPPPTLTELEMLATMDSESPKQPPRNNVMYYEDGEFHNGQVVELFTAKENYSDGSAMNRGVTDYDYINPSDYEHCTKMEGNLKIRYHFY